MAKRTKSRKTTTEITTVVELTREDLLRAARVPEEWRGFAVIESAPGEVIDRGIEVTWTRTVVRDGDEVPVDLDDDEASE